MEKIYQYYKKFDNKEIEGMFIAEESEIEKAIGTKNEFGILKRSDFKIMVDDKNFIKKFIKMFGDDTTYGYNPLEYKDE